MYLLLFCETGFNFGFLLAKHLLFLFQFVETGLNLVHDLFGPVEIFSGADKDVVDLLLLIVKFVGLSEVSFFRIFDNFRGVIGPDLR